MHSVESPKDWLKDWRIGNKRTSEDNPNYSIIKIDLNSEKSPGDLLSLKKQYKARHNEVGKGIHWELYKKQKLSILLETVLENETPKVLWDFEIQSDHLISARRPDLVIVHKKSNLPNSGLCSSGEKQRKRQQRQVLEACQRTKKVMEHEGDGDTTYNWCTRNSPQRLGKGDGRV